ncbi:MAG: DEAD/DEAH box helicase [Candidatus Omnitrophica bacterium]|nr:DEAD/DEAH box helicase [Candidatus Omnitrophota bacterium]
MKFTELNLPHNILKSLRRMGFEELTPIQEATYPVIARGQDLCALAETGSGKTSACAIPLVQKIDPEIKAIQGLVLVPTRELCLQYMREVEKVAENTSVVPFAVYGGMEKGFQISMLNHGVHILVATPGRLIDLVYDRVLDFSQVKVAILDEADELLKVGFLEDIEFILSCIVHEHQTLLFSATMADDIKKLAHDCLRDPVHISLVKTRAAPVSIDHWFIYAHPNAKQAELLRYLKAEKVKQAIIFCNARHLVDKLYRAIKRECRDTEYIHAGLSQDVRSSIFNRFTKQRIRFLIATDVVGRGMDFTHVSHVINWNLPKGDEQYTHRTGRTGRMGRKGKAFTFVTRHDLPHLEQLIQAKKIVPHWVGKDPFKSEDGPPHTARPPQPKRRHRHYYRRRR